eukprot:TRINITY_DN921_c0_g1_i2.p1 TRINITY_DN921_c0_g1~~TRINITY_DN921_c0_g1_i2.p1  ORF type:complete len:177 (-),score=25.72 TRINITY_DN921_c0_g1_i2:240-770(-)
MWQCHTIISELFTTVKERMNKHWSITTNHWPFALKRWVQSILMWQCHTIISELFTTVKERIKTLGAEHPDVAMSYNNIGAVYDSQGKNEQALEYYDKSLAIRIKTLGAEHPNVAGSYYNMACLFENQRKFQQAIDYFTKAKNIYAKVHGANHSETTDAQKRILDIVKSKMDECTVQ